MKGSRLENETVSWLARQVTPAGSGAEKEQQEQQEQLGLQPSEPWRSVQGQCEAGSPGELISNPELPLGEGLPKGASRLAKLSRGRNRYAHTIIRAISCL